MSWTVNVAMFGWIPAILALFSIVKPRNAVVIAFLAGWMFLPIANFPLPGLPDFTKATATSLGVLAAAFLFDPARILSVRPKLIDVPMAAWCAAPFCSSLENGLGAYDGLSAVVEHVVQWGIPYYIGRAYLRSTDDFHYFTRALFVAGLVYVPFCIFEVRMSPRLQADVYGIYLSRGIEYDGELGAWGSRPNVFMGVALAVGMFMTTASLAGFWLTRTRALRTLLGYPATWMLAALICTALLCKNLGALALLGLGVAALLLIGTLRSRIPVLLLIILGPAYVAMRVTGDWSGETLSSAAALINERRAESMQFRLDNEDILVAKALQKPVFGWGRWGRARVYRDDGKDISVTDGLWIIALGNTGLVGLTALGAALLTPVLVLARRMPAALWRHPQFSAVAACAVIVIVFALDCLFNAFPNPLYIAAAGGIATFATANAPWRQAAPATRPGRRTRRRPDFSRPAPGPGFPPGVSGSR